MFGTLSLPTNFELNKEFRKGFRSVERSSESLFITGEAGTGKTTLLAYLRQKTKKNFVILAPTALAAVNSGGVTIHSFFKFPPRLIQKEHIRRLPRIGNILAKLDLLIIDEASMMRADLLDGIDHSLRLNRDRFDEPFGGVQVVLFGDLHQLPPIIDRELAEHFNEFYQTPYFFSANVFKEDRFNFFCLKKNYRQREHEFLSLLNKIRTKTVSDTDLRLLNTRVDYTHSDQWAASITLVPTNATANAINLDRLHNLPGREFLYEAEIEGDFDAPSYPTETHLKLKVGAQVLMIKNDPEHRWVNGNIGEVIELRHDSIKVRIGHGVHDVGRMTWEKIKYRHDDETKKIVSYVVGSFEQFPTKLAWAITIHKSQGLTFDRIVLDLDHGAFSHGQAYVGLSRCRSLEGLILKRPVSFSDIIFDERIKRIFDLCRPIDGKPTGNGRR